MILFWAGDLETEKVVGGCALRARLTQDEANRILDLIIRKILLLGLANELLFSAAKELANERDVNAFAQLNKCCFQLLDSYPY